MDWQYELLAVFLLLPLLWWQTRNNNTNIKELINDNKQCSVNVINVYKEEMGKFYELLSHHIKEDNENFKWIKTEISKAIGKTRLTKDQILEVAKSRVWLTSEKKLDFIRLKQSNYNENVADLVLNNNEFRIIYQFKDNLIQKSNPVYKKPESKYGRAHFFSGFKIIGSYKINTFIFNIIALWFMSLCLYIILITDSFRKLLLYFNQLASSATPVRG